MSQAGSVSSSAPIPSTGVETLTGNTGGPVPATTNNINTVGTGSITVIDNPGTSTLTTQLTGLSNHNVLVGSGGPTITNVSPSATTGIPMISNGVAADPSFGTAAVSGGGTGDTSFTAYSVVCGGTTSTGPLQNVSGLGVSTQVLTSNGPSTLPTWQNSFTGVTGPGSSTDNSIATWSGTGGTALLSQGTPLVDSSGRMTNSNQPAFYVYLSSTQSNVTGNNTQYQIPFDTVMFDQGSNYDTSTFTYTFPINGIYNLNIILYIIGGSAASQLLVGWANINSEIFPAHTLFETNPASLGLATNGQFFTSASWLYQATAGDTISIWVDVAGGASNDVSVGSAPVVPPITATSFSGYLVC